MAKQPDIFPYRIREVRRGMNLSEFDSLWRQARAKHTTPKIKAMSMTFTRDIRNAGEEVGNEVIANLGIFLEKAMKNG